MEPVSPALAGRFSTTGRPGKSPPFTFEKSKGRSGPLVKTRASAAVSTGFHPCSGVLGSQKPHSAAKKKKSKSHPSILLPNPRKDGASEQQGGDSGRMLLFGAEQVFLPVECVKVCPAASDSSVTPRIVTHQAPPSMGFSRQGCWTG